MAVNASGYLVLTYTATYIEVELGLTAFQSSLILSLALVLYLPLISWAPGSDTFGRRRLLLINAIGFILLSYPAFVLLGQSGFLGVLLIQISLVALFSLNDSTFAVYFVEAVPPQVRLSGFAIPFNFGNAIFGGTAPFIATWLISVTDARTRRPSSSWGSAARAGRADPPGRLVRSEGRPGTGRPRGAGAARRP